VDSVIADCVTSQNFRHWSAEASSDRLRGLAKPGHWTERLISCQKDWWWLSRQRVVMLNFVWTNHFRDHPCFTAFRMKIEQNSCVIVKFNAILGESMIYAN